MNIYFNNIVWLIAKGDAQPLGTMDKATCWAYKVLLAHRLVKRDADDIGMMIGYHLTETSFDDELHSTDAKLRCQHAVKRYRRAATLQMAKDGTTDIVFNARCFKLGSKLFAHAAQLNMLIAHLASSAACDAAANRLGSFGNDDDAIAMSFVVALLYLLLYLINIIWYLWDDTHIGTAGYCAM